MSRAFAFRTIAGIRPHIRAVAEKLIEARFVEGEMELIEDYTAQIPALTIANILGLPERDMPDFTRWVYSFSRVFSPSFTSTEVPEIAESAGRLQSYVEGILAERRDAPQNDLITSFLHTAEEGGLSALELVSQLVTVIIGGSDTTRAAMAIQTALLLQNRVQWEAVCRDSALIPGAVSEALRYEPVAASVPRFTLADIQIDGFVVPAKRILTLSTIAAMRDPALYADPDTFDIKRKDHPRWHLVFGGGAHRCLGEALARGELEEGLAALVSRLPRLELSSEGLRLDGHGGIRRIEPLRVAWRR